jgi:hypothetical protein
MITLVLRSPAVTTKIERPPMPSKGLSTTLPCSLRNSRSAVRERVTRLGGVQWGNHAV